MARKRKSAAGNDAEPNGPSVEDKIARLLALIVVKEMDSVDAALTLNRIGFDAREISALLDVGPGYLKVAKFRKRGAAKKPRTKR